MKYVVIDLEMNPIASVYMAERAICKLEVIEIGAILFLSQGFSFPYTYTFSMKVLMISAFSSLISV